MGQPVRLSLVEAGVLATVWLWTVPVAAHGAFGGPRNPAHAQARGRANKPAGKKNANGELGPAPIEQLRNMSPEERRRFLDSLPPARRQRLQQRLNQYEQLPPQERQRLQRTYEKFQQLTPERQEAMRQGFRGFSQLPPDRRQALREEMRNLRSMSPAERRKRVDSREFREQYSSEERGIMDQMTQLAPNR